MSNLVPFGTAPVPAYFAGALAPEDSNIAAKNTVPALSFRGKTWRIAIDDNETVVTNREGEPSTTVSVIVLDQVKKRSRVFYEGQYVAGENKAPRCSSIDGVTPDADIKEPIAKTCATCPHAVKGSKITAQGKPTTLCAATKRVAVIPTSKLDFTALLLRLAQTSMWDKSTENAEWKGWDQYMDYLRAQGATNTAQVVTKIKFDHNVEYPKLLFKAERWCTPEEWAVVGQRWKSDEVKDLLLGKSAPAEEEGDYDAPAAAPAVAAPTAQPAAPAAEAAAPTPARAPRRPRTPNQAAAASPEYVPPAAAAAPAVAAGDDGEDDGSWGEAPAAQPAPTAQQPAAPAAAPVSQPAAAAPATGNAGLTSLLGSWDD